MGLAAVAGAQSVLSGDDLEDAPAVSKRRDRVLVATILSTR